MAAAATDRSALEQLSDEQLTDLQHGFDMYCEDGTTSLPTSRIGALVRARIHFRAAFVDRGAGHK